MNEVGKAAVFAARDGNFMDGLITLVTECSSLLEEPRELNTAREWVRQVEHYGPLTAAVWLERNLMLNSRKRIASYVQGTKQRRLRKLKTERYVVPLNSLAIVAAAFQARAELDELVAQIA